MTHPANPTTLEPPPPPEDPHRLGTLTDLRPADELLCGRLTAAQRGEAGLAALPIGRPWDLLTQQTEALLEELSHVRLMEVAGFEVATPQQTPHVVRLGADAHPLWLGEGVSLTPGVVLDTSNGPIALGPRTQVGAFACLEGPIAYGADGVVAPHTLLRGPVTAGDWVKLGGEVKGAIIHNYTNKAHFGYLGDSVVGAWCNLGAGTTVSNLKNTYGPVRMAVHGAERPEPDVPTAFLDTGRQFQGPVLGDYVRTAIGSRLLTGSAIGTGSCLVLSGFGPKFLRRMRFLTDRGDAAMEPDAMLTTVRRMRSRRGLELDAVLAERLRAWMA